jgi:HAMP domain-containing protein
MLETKILWHFMELIVSDNNVAADTPEEDANADTPSNNQLSRPAYFNEEIENLKQQLEALRTNHTYLEKEKSQLIDELEQMNNAVEAERLEMTVHAKELKDKINELSNAKVRMLAKLSEQSDGIREQSAEWENLKEKMEQTIRELTLEREQFLLQNGTDEQLEEFKKRKVENEELFAEMETSRLSPPMLERQDSLASNRFIAVPPFEISETLVLLQEKTGSLRLELADIKKQFIANNNAFQKNFEDQVATLQSLSPNYVTPTETEPSIGLTPVTPEFPRTGSEQFESNDVKFAPRIRGTVSIVGGRFSRKARYIEIGLKGMLIFRTKEDHQKLEKPVEVKSLKGVKVFIVDKAKKDEQGIFKLKFLDGSKVKIDTHNTENRDKFISCVNKVIAMNC